MDNPVDKWHLFFIYSIRITFRRLVVDKKICSAERPCSDFRTCPACARKRQAAIADTAEKMEAMGEPLHLTVIRPPANTAESLRATRAAIFRAGLAKMGIWTVETGGQFAGLHLNVLSTAPKVPPSFRGLTWSEAINTSARVAAAYITKQSGMPPASQYSGRLYGTFGNLKDLFVRDDMPLLIQAAAIEQAVDYKPARLSQFERDFIEQKTSETTSKTHAEYMAIAKSHLPTIWAMVEKRQAARR